MILTDPAALSYSPVRIISLVPSQTELLHYLGLDDETIGITKFCVHPEEWFRHKARIGGTKQIRIGLIRSLNPDLIIANKEENNATDIYALAQDFPVWVTDVQDLQDAKKMIRDIGMLTHRTVQAATLIDLIGLAFASIKGIPGGTKRSAAYLIWKEPYMAAGGDTFIHAMMQAAGFDNIFATAQRYPEVTPEDILRHKPDIILLSSEPYPFSNKHIAQLADVFPGTNLMLVDGEMFSWYGSRLLKAADYFRHLFDEYKRVGKGS